MIHYFLIDYFQLGPIKFYGWGVFLALAFFIGLAFGIKQLKKIGIDGSKTINLTILTYLGAMIGSRLFFVLQSPIEFFKNPYGFFETSGGLMFYGGFFGGLLAAWLYLKKDRKFLLAADLMAPVICLSLAIGRIGCFLTNDHQGAITFLPWGISLPDGTLRHPVALYLILFDLALFVFLWWYRKRVKSAGRVFLIFLILYGAGRFFLDFTREASADPHFWIFSTSQWISIIIFLFSILLFFWQQKKNQAARVPTNH